MTCTKRHPMWPTALSVMWASTVQVSLPDPCSPLLRIPPDHLNNTLVPLPPHLSRLTLERDARPCLTPRLVGPSDVHPSMHVLSQNPLEGTATHPLPSTLSGVECDRGRRLNCKAAVSDRAQPQAGSTDLDHPRISTSEKWARIHAQSASAFRRCALLSSPHTCVPRQ